MSNRVHDGSGPLWAVRLSSTPSGRATCGSGPSTRSTTCRGRTSARTLSSTSNIRSRIIEGRCASLVWPSATRCGRARCASTASLDNPELRETARFEWSALDSWFEEDEEIFVHPRSPYVRVDAQRSTRRVRIELNGVVLAESSSPVMVFETGLPTRYYLNRTEVDFSHLAAFEHRDSLPLQGNDDRVLVGRAGSRSICRSGVGLRLPDGPAAGDRRPRSAFYNEKVDVFVDGEQVPRPTTHFS